MTRSKQQAYPHTENHTRTPRSLPGFIGFSPKASKLSLFRRVNLGLQAFHRGASGLGALEVFRVGFSIRTRRKLPFRRAMCLSEPRTFRCPRSEEYTFNHSRIPLRSIPELPDFGKVWGPCYNAMFSYWTRVSGLSVQNEDTFWETRGSSNF